VCGHFTQVSTREVLYRYYRLCQEGLDVPQALAAFLGCRLCFSAIHPAHQTWLCQDEWKSRILPRHDILDTCKPAILWSGDEGEDGTRWCARHRV
jgi:hypothetical protein